MIPLDNNDFGDLNILQASYLLQIRKATFLILHSDDVTIPPTYPILHDDDDIVIVKQVYPTLHHVILEMMMMMMMMMF